MAIRARRPAATETLRRARGKDWKDATPPVKMVREDFSQLFFCYLLKIVLLNLHKIMYESKYTKETFFHLLVKYFV